MNEAAALIRANQRVQSHFGMRGLLAWGDRKAGAPGWKSAMTMRDKRENKEKLSENKRINLYFFSFFVYTDSIRTVFWGDDRSEQTATEGKGGLRYAYYVCRGDT